MRRSGFRMVRRWSSTAAKDLSSPATTPSNSPVGVRTIHPPATAQSNYDPPMKRIPSLSLLCAMLAIGGLRPALQAAEDPAHNELRTLRTEVIAAITKGDID